MDIGKTVTPKAFHNAFLRAGSMPMELVRALFPELPLTRDFEPGGTFYGEVPAAR